MLSSSDASDFSSRNAPRLQSPNKLLPSTVMLDILPRFIGVYYPPFYKIRCFRAVKPLSATLMIKKLIPCFHSCTVVSAYIEIL